MGAFELYYATGNQQVDDILCGTIAILEMLFAERIKAYYLHGSFIDGTGIETSDIDLFLIAQGKFTPQEQEKLQRIMHSCARFSPLMVEMLVLDENLLLQKGHFRIKSASKLLWGEDIRERMPEQTFDQYVGMYAPFPFVYSAQMLRGMERLVAPLDYPQAAGTFYGYDQPLLPPGNSQQQNIKKLVTGVCWAATVLIAWQSGKTVPGKRASVEMYREYVHDEWITFIEEIYALGNQRWRYLVPQTPEERQRLRELCAQTLVFEKHYLSCYQAYLRENLQKDAESKSIAVQQLSKLFLDEESIAALQAIALTTLK